MKEQDSQFEHLGAVRETIESVAVAIVLAFVLRAFVVEAFVIPTGSMAPRLMGQHWQFDCPACGMHYAFGIRTHGGRSVGITRQLSGPAAYCPNCGHRHAFQRAYPYSGDRVLVLKYFYRFREPKSWDVIVFKNPQDNDQNYIKRLIGLPGQMLEIVHGDVFYRQGEDLNGDRVIDKADFALADKEGACRWRILRKGHKTQDVMWQVVFDNDFQPDPDVYREGGGEWASPWRPADDEAWKLDGHGGRTFEFAGSRKRSRRRFEIDRKSFCPKYAYNPLESPRYEESRDVCYDLKLAFQFVPQADDARVGLELSSFEDLFRAWVGADGRCLLERRRAGEQQWNELDRGRADLQPGRACDVALTHVERRVTLWVDARPVLQTTDLQYTSDEETLRKAVRAYTDDDEEVPTPTVAILAEGGPAQLRHVKVMRDVFYTDAKVWVGDTRTLDPGHGTTGNPIVLRKFLDRPNMDEFYVLGDNSPASKDSRMWGHHALTLREEKSYENGTVPRYSMIGKAFFVYWPGGFRPPVGEKLPIVPNVGRMRLIR